MEAIRAPKREDVSQEDCWDLSSLYKNNAQWSADLSLLQGLEEQVEAFEGTLGNSIEELKGALDHYTQANLLAERLFVFAKLQSDQDLKNQVTKELLNRAMAAMTRISAASAYLVPEILAIPEATIKKYLADPDLADYKRMLEEIVRYRPHTLSSGEEQLLALSGEVNASFGQLFANLIDADLKFSPVMVGNKKLPLTNQSFPSLIKSPERAVRKQAFKHYYEQYFFHKNTLAELYGSSIKKDYFISRARKFNNTLERCLFDDNIPVNVYLNLIEAVESNLAPLHDYYEFRNKHLGLDSQEMYDTFVPLQSDVQIVIPFELACDVIISSCKPLGDEYVSVLTDGLKQERWVDRYENIGKRSGAYSSGCHGSKPYILLNYSETQLRDVFVFAHEVGHSMHSYFSRQSQSYQDSTYSIFAAEVASAFNEILLMSELRKRFANDPQMSGYLLNSQLDDIKATFFRQTMFAEFELIVHQAVARGEGLSQGYFRDVYQPLLQKYFGPAVNTTHLAELECLRIPHFYSPFYVFKYATGISAAVALSQEILGGSSDALEGYLTFLRSGKSKYPLELLKDAGADLSTSVCVEKTSDLFRELLDSLKTHLSSIKKVIKEEKPANPSFEELLAKLSTKPEPQNK